MNTLFYTEPKTVEQGPDSVAWHLLKVLAKKIDITYCPRLTSSKALNVFNVYRRCLSNQFDIIHYNLVPSSFNGTYFLLNIANYQKTPTILNIHGLLQMENAYEPKRLAHLIWLDCFNSLKRVDRVVVNSEYMKQMIAYFYRLNTEKIVVIPNGIDFEKFSSCTSQTKLAGDPAVLSVSRVCILKGFGTIVDAILQLKQELPNIKVHLIGYATKEYLDLAKRKGVEKFLVFHGKVPHSLVPMYLKSADFGIYGSILYEGFGISLVEAMAAGLPVIASDIDTYRQIVSDGQDGLLFERSNAEELSKAILTMSKDLNLRRKLSQNAQITTARYDWGNIAEEYLSLYRTISNRNS